MMDYFDQAADRYAKLAMNPGWIDWVRDHVKKLQQNPIYQNLGAAVAQRKKYYEEQQGNGTYPSNPVEPAASPPGTQTGMGDHQSANNGREQANAGNQARNPVNGSKSPPVVNAERHQRTSGLARPKANR